MYSLFDSFFYPRPLVYVVSEERLREAERQQKQVEVDELTGRIEAYEAQAKEVVAKAKERLEVLKQELSALPAAS